MSDVTPEEAESLAKEHFTCFPITWDMQDEECTLTRPDLDYVQLKENRFVKNVGVGKMMVFLDSKKTQMPNLIL